MRTSDGVRERERVCVCVCELVSEKESGKTRERERSIAKVGRSDQNVNVLLGGRPGPHCAADGRRRDASPPEHELCIQGRG